MKQKTKTVQSINRAAAILKILSAGGPYSLASISQGVDLSKSTVHRLLKTLEASEFVVQDPITRRYYLGQFIVRIASNYRISHQNLIICALDEMEHLRDVSGETVCLSIPMGRNRYTLEELPSKQNVKFTLGKGFSGPLHVGSAGKALLSQLTNTELDRLLRHLNIGPNSDTKPVDKKTLIADVEIARTQGYSISFGEVINDAAAISVPIKNYICPACLSIFCPAYRFNSMTKFLPEMLKAAEHISLESSEYIT
jgi:DNA-binding IclR family transcriptional regulator